LVRTYTGLLLCSLTALLVNRGLVAAEIPILLVLLVQLISDVDVRFCSRMACFPWTCWAASGEDGLDEDRWVELERIAARCLECVDLELTSGLFDFMKVMRASGQEREGYAFVNMALNEASVHAELASIPAECRHSKVQNTSQSNRRGRRRAARRIGAESFVNSIVGEWQHVAEHIDAETLPARRTTQAILQSICTTGLKKDKEAFVQAAASGQRLHSRLREYFRKRSKSRAISAWNAFQAYHQQGQAFIGEVWGQMLRTWLLNGEASRALKRNRSGSSGRQSSMLPWQS
jgi:hypothetical protein